MNVILPYLFFIHFFLIGCHTDNSSTSTKTKSDTASKKATVPNKQIDTTPHTIKVSPIVYDSTKYYIYVTFDDGPQNGTNICYTICKQLGIKATFFMVGKHVSSISAQKLVDSIRNDYPLILLANHSYTHANDKYKAFYQHVSSCYADFEKAQASLHVPFKIIRLPGNSAWVREKENKASSLVKPVCHLLDSAGYNVIGWDEEWNFSRDGKCLPVETPEKLYKSIQKLVTQQQTHVKNHLVLLTHDRMFQRPAYADSLKHFLTLLKQNPQFVLETIDHYPGLKTLH